MIATLGAKGPEGFIFRSFRRNPFIRPLGSASKIPAGNGTAVTGYTLDDTLFLFPVVHISDAIEHPSPEITCREKSPFVDKFKISRRTILPKHLESICFSGLLSNFFNQFLEFFGTSDGRFSCSGHSNGLEIL